MLYMSTQMNTLGGIVAKTYRPVGTGSVYQRKDGRWIGRLDVGFTENGARRFRSVSADTKRKAETKLAELLKSVQSETSTLSARTTVKAWCDEWLPRQQERVRPNAYAADASAVRQWIIPTLGKRRLVDLTPADLRKLDAAVIAKRSRSTARRVRATLSVALKAASLEGHAIPARIFQVPPPALEQTDRTAIPVPDALAILKAAEAEPLRARWVAALLQGMRAGECRGLAWDAVDLAAGTIDVSWQMQELVSLHGCGGDCGKVRAAGCPRRVFRVPVGYERRQVQGRWHLVRPKTSAGSRTIPLVPWMSAELARAQEAADGPLVWGMRGGKVWTDKDDLAAWHALQASAGVSHPDGRPYHLHEARHTTATLLLALGVDPMVVTAILGHSTILSSHKYMHADLAMLRTALDGVAARLELEGNDSLGK